MGDRKKAEAARYATKAMRELVVGYRSLMEDASRAQALTLPQLRLLYAVSEHSEDSAAALARRCQVTPQTLQTMLTRAVREGWIERGTSERSQRILTAHLTPKGQSVLQVGLAMAEQIEARVWQGVPLKELSAFNRMLDRALANLRESLPPGGEGGSKVGQDRSRAQQDTTDGIRGVRSRLVPE